MPEITDEARELAARAAEMVDSGKGKRTDTLTQLKALVPGVEDFDTNEQLKSTLATAFGADVALPARIFKKMNWPWPFRSVLREELLAIERRRGTAQPSQASKAADVYAFGRSMETLGLAFSGGGIRSATFCLGALQRLAEKGFLRQVDYLSTVSGGGYIGTWLTAWIARTKDRPEAAPGANRDAVINALAPSQHSDPSADAVRPIRFLRQFSNYLTPQLGLFSSDTWAMAAVYVRNVTLNLLILITAFATLLLVPRLLGYFWLVHFGYFWPMGLGLTLLGLAVGFIAMNVDKATTGQDTDKPSDVRGFYGPLRVQIFCVAPLLIGAYSVSWWLWQNTAKIPDILSFWGIVFPLAGFASLSLLLGSRSHLGRRFEERIRNNRLQRGVVRFLVPAGVGVAGWALFHGYVALLKLLPACDCSAAWYALVFGPPVFLMVLSVAGIVHVGLLGVDLLDSGREWLSRFRGVTNIYTTYWLALFGASIFGGLLYAKFALWSFRTVSTLGAAWIATTVFSFLTGGSSKATDAKDPQHGVSGWQIVARIGPPVFAIGFVWCIAMAVHWLLASTVGSTLQVVQSTYWQVLGTEHLFGGIRTPGTLAAVCCGVSLVLAWRVDINEFSMHHFYKNRLVRCYLGATRGDDRKPNPFTGFDDGDDVRLADCLPAENGGPYHIVNTTLNLSAGKELAWQERKAASFIFSPLFSGYDVNTAVNGSTKNKDEAGETGGSLRSCAYRQTSKYAFNRGVHIGTAMSISGAAADPNQGYNTSPAVAFLMTIFDVRLGWWLGNPRKDKKSELPSPIFGLAALISEILGTTDDSTNFINLSDGGHFDNIGLYELVRRRCRYIVVCDAEQDRLYQFGGLGMAIRKCRIDFGAEIEVDPGQIIPNSETGRSEAHCAVGQIKYQDGSKGTLIYIKASMTGDEPEDLIEYASSHPAFPHESTADQWFAESQFESYRKLGYHAVSHTFGPSDVFAKSDPVKGDEEGSVADRCQALERTWSAVNPGLKPHATKHTQTLVTLMTQVGTSSGLRQLGAELFPGSPSAWNRRDESAEFYFCMSLIQLVEDIYFDLNLQDKQWRHDPRIQGWMTLFKGWADAPTMKKTWGTQAKTFREDFQDFWDSLKPPSGPEAERIGGPIGDDAGDA